VPRGARWSIRKLASSIDPRDVVARGGRGLHATDWGLRLEGASAGLRIRSLDSGLVAPGRLSLLAFDDLLPRTAVGMHFLLQNNVWGTNFPLWCEDDARLRFTRGVS
jgi:hypothetical protein